MGHRAGKHCCGTTLDAVLRQRAKKHRYAALLLKGVIMLTLCSKRDDEAIQGEQQRVPLGSYRWNPKMKLLEHITSCSPCPQLRQQ